MGNVTQIIPKIGESTCDSYRNCYLYAVIRWAKPEIVVETGVAAGISSFSILQAMEDNGRGKLYSIDLPKSKLELPANQQLGFIVPERLKTRWELELGDARQELPKLLRRLGQIDIFIHDSLHEYEHMKFEYEQAWPFIRRGGLLLSDDLQSSSAFQEFLDRNALTASTFTRHTQRYDVQFGFVVKP